MLPFHDKILLNDPVVEYRRLIGGSVLVVRVICGDGNDSLISSVMETLTPRRTIEPFSLHLNEILEYLADTNKRLIEFRNQSNPPLVNSTITGANQ